MSLCFACSIVVLEAGASCLVETAVFSLSAGFDTIIAGLQWSLLYLVKFPNIQDRIYQEIGNVAFLM